MSEVYNHKHHLPKSAQLHYIDNTLIEAHPSSDEPDISSAAHVMVGERHGKFDLVHMTAYMLSQIEQLRHDNISLLHLLAQIREACGDNGKRMQDELVEYIRDEWQGHISHIALLKASLNKERQEADALREALRDCQTVAIMRGDKFLADFIDNTGVLYRSAHLAGLLEK